MWLLRAHPPACRVRPGEGGSRIRLTEEQNSPSSSMTWSLNACLGRNYPSGKDYFSKRSARIQMVHSNMGSSCLSFQLGMCTRSRRTRDDGYGLGWLKLSIYPPAIFLLVTVAVSYREPRLRPHGCRTRKIPLTENRTFGRGRGRRSNCAI